MKEEIANGQQVLIFLNRRGFAPTLMCHDCGWIADCRNCDTRLILHLNPKRLLCHHCDLQAAIPSNCPICANPALTPMGVGTEQSEETINSLFPDTPVLRVDRDSTRTKRAMGEKLSLINRGDPCILVGTQMLAKGHHFPHVTLVALLEADSGLFSADFRGPERMAQLITQVAGRAGRGERPGKVLIQTHLPGHDLLQRLLREGYNAVAEQLLHERRVADLPPSCYWVLFRAEALDERAPDKLLSEIREWSTAYLAQNSKAQVSMFGPMPAILYRRNNRFRSLLIIQSADRALIHQLAGFLCPLLEESPSARRVRWSIDVDPLECF